MSEFTQIETERLTLRRLRESDLDSYVAYLNDPIVAKYQTWSTITKTQAEDTIAEQSLLGPGTPHEPFLFAVEVKRNSALAGHVVLTVLEKDHLQAEIGLTFAREYQGQGIAKEAAARVLDYAFQDLNLHRVVAITDCENLKSITLLEKLGMRREGHFVENIWFKGKWGDEFLYAVLHDEWLNKSVS